MKIVKVEFQKNGVAPMYVNDTSNVMINYNVFDEDMFNLIRETQERYRNSTYNELDELVEYLLTEAFTQECEIVKESFGKVEGKDDYYYQAVAYAEVKLDILPNYKFECTYEIDDKLSNLKHTENYIDMLIKAESYVEKHSEEWA